MSAPLLDTGAWIPVTERLPKRDERVLIYASGQVWTGAMVQHQDEFVKRKEPYYGTWRREMNSSDHFDEVSDYVFPSHWMPLPFAPVP